MPSKKSRIRLYADECIPVPTVTYLKEKGCSIVHAYDLHYVDKKDELHFKKSKLLKRVLLSLDNDFKKFEGASMKSHPGIILISTGNNTPKHINSIVNKALKEISDEAVKHSIHRVTIDKITVDKPSEFKRKKK